ncbi:substrate-binding periplasmic protein [Ectopseudomonas hydrolytica]|uniref:substrate-binding periplasmic protein n=1 Tax=Ectopseudomonas hydrolytica TaxID=2493633 RepID=UPI0018A7DC3F|nr:transporter substrate-binding domain-containing protein [Pseudomonas hydrolytica]MBF8160433.1 transporter substrate-binding domain-containing protein [Pseudomonas mendocina]UTH33447.1 transporter substrate-binding domain-containing protein [Pseudomonas hydrolytica]UZZ12719.1 transporter substrate-binding domain-containing protein [Pseudomonas mendocina]
MKPVRLCLFSSLLLTPAALAQTYVVGVEELPFAPHYSLDGEGQYRGFAREVLDAFAADSGVGLSYKALPVDQLLPALQRGEIDLKYPDSPHWAGAQKAGMTLHYSQAVVDYVDGVLVAPQRKGQAVERLGRLAMVQGWTPRGYEQAIDSGQIQLSYSDDLRQMIRQALKQDTDGAYFNVVVATHYLDNIRARPGALVFDPKLPHTRGSFHLSSLRHPQLIARFDRFLVERSAQVAALKASHRVEANLDSDYLGLEQWKVDYFERQKAKAGAQAPASSTR